MSKEAMKLRTAAKKVVELCSERPLSLGKWFIDMSEACESLREALAKPDFWEGYVPEPVKPAQQEPVVVFREIKVGEYVLRFWPSDNGWMCGITSEMMQALAEQPAQHHSKAWPPSHWTDYERSIAAAEREACAQIAETAEPYQAADLIRARSNT